MKTLSIRSLVLVPLLVCSTSSRAEDCDKAFALAEEAVAALEAEKFEEGLTRLDRAMELCTHSDFPRIKAMAYVNMGQADNCKIWAAKALSLDGQLANNYDTMGECLYDLAEFSDAQKHYESAVFRDPNQPDYLWSLLIGSARTGDLKTAQSAAQKLVQLDPEQEKDPLFHMMLSQAHLNSGNLEAAAAALAPIPNVLSTTHAKVLIEQGKPDEAVSILEKVATDEASDHILVADIILSFQAAGRPDRAMALYQQFTKNYRDRRRYIEKGMKALQKNFQSLANRPSIDSIWYDIENSFIGFRSALQTADVEAYKSWQSARRETPADLERFQGNAEALKSAGLQLELESIELDRTGTEAKVTFTIGKPGDTENVERDALVLVFENNDWLIYKD